MEITVQIPDDVAALVTRRGKDPARAMIEAFGLEACRRRGISGYQLRTLPGIGSRYELDEFLKENEVEKYTTQDLDQDLATIKRFEVASDEISKPP